MESLSPDQFSPRVAEVYSALREDRVIFQPAETADLEVLRGEVERIARAMDDEGCPPPMLWSGVPWPTRSADPGTQGLSGPPVLSLSVGGTNSVFVALQLEAGEVIGLDPAGKLCRGAALADLASRHVRPTPTDRDVADGFAMVERIVDGVAGVYRDVSVLEHCQHLVLSWGYPGESVRTAETLLGGLTARTRQMTKDQAAFTPQFAGRDIGALFADAFHRRLGWRPSVTVANDGVMALHYFLSSSHRERHGQIGLFINGTGANFAIAERYLVRPEGAVSRGGESYRPERCRTGSGTPGANESRYFVNYEIGSLDLVATRSRFDVEGPYPIEMNALSGGNAFQQIFRALVREHLGLDRHRALLASFRERRADAREPGGPELARLATDGAAETTGSLFPGFELDPRERELLRLFARAAFARSALHAALILAAVTARLGFGKGQGGRPDLLALEGSVWRTPGYAALVREDWGRLVGHGLSVELEHEPDFNASLRGPAYLAALHP